MNDQLSPGQSEDQRTTDAQWDCQAPAAVPVDEAEVLLQVAGIHVTLAQLQLGAGVVVHVVHTHLLHNAKATLKPRNREREFLYLIDLLIYLVDNVIQRDLE